MSKKTGLILDVSGIQKYIFGTSRLKQIVGASGNIRDIISDMDDSLLSEIIPESGEIIYAGGGNALVLFNTDKKATEFAKDWSLRVLEKYPGVQPVAGLYTGEYSDDKFGVFLYKCREQLNISKTKNSANVVLQRYGVTAECIYTGSSAQYYDNKIKAKPKSSIKEYYSVIAKVKNSGYESANKRFVKEYGFNFSENFEELSGETGRDYRSGMAIVHIDGNDMGNRFFKLNTRNEYKQTSKCVRDLFKNALLAVTKEINEIQKEYQKNLGLGNGVFPFRPIIVGGDDVTYVCHASLGLWSAHKILIHISNQQKDIENPITACAGIAFTKPSYPFAQGYELAEELCNTAKEKRREGGEKTQNISFLDFHILKGGAFSNLRTVRNQGYKYGKVKLIGRPFGVEKGQEAYEWLVETGKKMVLGNKENKWPKNKIKELREVVYKGGSAIEDLYIHMKKQKKKTPNLESRDPRKELGMPQTLDLCEFLDVYPDWLLEWEKTNSKEESK